VSTRKLIGGAQAKAGAKRRKRAILELWRMGQMYQPGTSQRFRVESRLQALRDTHKASHMTDAQKDESFRAILQRGV
jgi:hypothetical protein